jgi:rifampin ADP-ribosylating transferase
MTAIDDLSSQRFYHGTKADLEPRDLIEPGYNSNYGKRKKAAYVYLTATLDAATWGPSWHSARTRQNLHRRTDRPD